MTSFFTSNIQAYISGHYSLLCDDFREFSIRAQEKWPRLRLTAEFRERIQVQEILSNQLVDLINVPFRPLGEEQARIDEFIFDLRM